MREQTAVIGDQMETGGIAIQRLAGAKKNSPDHQKRHDCQYLDQREPELHLGEPFHADHIHGTDDRQRAEGKHPLRNVAERAPVVHIQRDGGDIDNPGHRPVDEVHPARNVSRFFAEELAGVGDEAAAGRAMKHQLAKRA
ncbi:Uncharacterised protein [Klebsiella oxytoca]|nr:Uncharacterised protein [Klebsiella oxytoca]